MKISIERAELLKAMGWAQSVVERRASIPILGNVLIEADGARVSFRSTDLDVEAIAAAPAVVEAAGVVTVPAHMLHEIARKLPDGVMVAMAASEDTGRLDVRAGRSRFTLATLPPEDFPILANGDYASTFTCSAAVLARLFGKSKFAMSTEETRYYLKGVFLHEAQGPDESPVLRAVATDGHRLARIDAPLPDGARGMPSVIVPRKSVLGLSKMLEGGAPITVAVSETKVRFATAGFTLTSKVVDGVFPDYARVIPAANTRRLEVDAAEFVEAVDRAATVSSERAQAVKLTLAADRLIVSVGAPDASAAEEDLAVAYDAEPLDIGINAKYLLTLVAQVESENAVFLFGSPGDPVLMRDGPDESATYVVMPMRV